MPDILERALPIILLHFSFPQGGLHHHHLLNLEPKAARLKHLALPPFSFYVLRASSIREAPFFIVYVLL